MMRQDFLLSSGDCNDNDPSILGVGSESGCPATSAMPSYNQILHLWMVNTGYKVRRSLEGWCDMTNDGGRAGPWIGYTQ